MEVAITKISQNGQIVIPSEIRRDANIKPSTKFLVFNRDGNIFLKQLKKENLMNDMRIVEQVRIAEEGIKKGKYVKASTKMSDKDIDNLLMA